MRTTKLTNRKLQDKLGQLSVFRSYHADEKGRDQRPKLPPLVSLKVARIMASLETENDVLEKELKALAKAHITTNAKGTQIPVLAPIGDKTAQCDHEPENLVPITTPGNEGKWKCLTCGTHFLPHPSSMMLTDGEEYHKRRTELLDGEVEVSTLTLSMAEIAQFPEVPEGVMQALLPFVDLDTKVPDKKSSKPKPEDAEGDE